MFYDFSQIPMWLFVALLVGGVVGWFSYVDMPPRRGWFEGWAKWGAAAFAIGLLVAILKLLPGRAGFWLETALFLFFVYIVGCFLGGVLKMALSTANPVRAVAVEAEPAPAVATAVMAAPVATAAPRVVAAIAEPPRVAADPTTDSMLAAGAMRRSEAERLEEEAASAAAVEAARRAAREAAEAEANRKAAALLNAGAASSAETTKADAEKKATADAAAKAAPAHPGQQPAARAGDGAADDLKLIKGIGPKNEKTLNGLGVWTFSQIADWSPHNAIWMGHHMAFPGRIERERWIPQARLLAAGVDTPFSTGVKSGAIKIDESADAPLSDAEAEAFAAAMPAAAPTVEGEDAHEGARPLGLAAPKGGAPDDLKLIKGIGKQNEARLHGLGVWHFDQIAAWTHENVKWVGSYLAFPGRIDREEWIKQALELAAGIKTEFARRVEAGLVKTSADDGSHGQDNIAKVDPKP
jgi:predicted flap endonuclease-1-like 5' DNA nuclease